MSVLLDTSAGAVTVDLFTEECPIASQNFLKLAAAGMYDGCLFFSILPGQLAQTGDLTGTGSGGTSIHGAVQGEAHRFIRSEVGAAGRKHSGAGLLGMALHGGAHTAASQFYITLDRPLPAMDKTHTIFGEVVEGAEVLPVLSGLFLDKGGRPLQDVRIRAAHVLFDPTPGVPGADKLPRPRLATSDGRPEAETVEARLEFAASNSALAAAAEAEGDSEAAAAARAAKAEQAAAEEARSRAVVLEMVGDLPDADLAPPDTVLFVAKLNPVTTDGDLELIFSRHGEILSCEIQRDWKTGDSLGYAFIEFADRAACEAAYLKMNNVLIDDRRIKVDFSQSVAKLWSQRARAAAGGAGGLTAAARQATRAAHLGLPNQAIAANGPASSRPQHPPGSGGYAPPSVARGGQRADRSTHDGGRRDDWRSRNDRGDRRAHDEQDDHRPHRRRDDGRYGDRGKWGRERRYDERRYDEGRSDARRYEERQRHHRGRDRSRSPPRRYR